MLKKSSKKAAERIVRHTLADGTTRVYRYSAYRPKKAKAVGYTVGDLIAAWQRSPEWKATAPKTKEYYSVYIKPLMGMQHVEASRVERRQLLDIRNAIATARGEGAANGFIRTASAVFGWATDNDWIKFTPVARVKRLKGGHLPTWTTQDVELRRIARPASQINASTATSVAKAVRRELGAITMARPFAGRGGRGQPERGPCAVRARDKPSTEPNSAIIRGRMRRPSSGDRSSVLAHSRPT